MIQDRQARQASIFPADRMENNIATVIGVGAIGRQVALQLAAIGCPKIQLVDFDVVEDANLGPQGFLETDVGLHKTTAVHKLIRQINSEIEVTPLTERVKRSHELGNIIFCCVDSIGTRRLIYESMLNTALQMDRCDLFLDARMSAEVIRVLTVFDDASNRHYPNTLFQANEAFVGSCTAKSTIFTANIAAGLLVGQYSKFLRKFPCDADVTFNLLSMELTVEDMPVMA